MGGLGGKEELFTEKRKDGTFIENKKEAKGCMGASKIRKRISLPKKKKKVHRKKI